MKTHKAPIAPHQRIVLSQPLPAEQCRYGTTDFFDSKSRTCPWRSLPSIQTNSRQSALVEAFSPGKVEQGTSSYGFGWNLVDESGNKYLWHQGNQAGFRASIGRRLTDRVVVIMLTNKGNCKRMAINAAIQNILADKPYVLPGTV